MLSCIFHFKDKKHIKYKKQHTGAGILAVSGALVCVMALASACSSFPADTDEGDEAEYIEYNGVRKNRNDLSDDTVQWMEWYQSLPEDEQEALSIIPAEFSSDGFSATQEGESGSAARQHAYHYSEALTDDELFETEELVRLNYEEANNAEIFEVVPDDFSWYSNKGIEDEYTPGNIIIYRILTPENRLNGNGYLIVSIGRHSKSDPWKIINSGF